MVDLSQILLELLPLPNIFVDIRDYIDDEKPLESSAYSELFPFHFK